MLELKKIINKREKYIAPSFSLAYDNPIHIVKGKGQYLYDYKGNKYLDVVNNISHVGHCHPKVVEAAYKQNKILNTNTRYLHESIINYAQNICATLPDDLGVCFFTNSGSESNDLALRIARQYNDSYESIVIAGAYHGHTQALIDVSPYKFNGKGGLGARDFVHVVPMPDKYRGEHINKNFKFEKYYIDKVKHIIADIENRGKQLALFIIEPILGCGGQVKLPNIFLKESFRAVKNAGGLCIVDEVQIGFGRLGSHFWGFEMSSVKPDIITLGKSIGNGHPLSVTITRKDIADKFNNGMEYFNSFGGNPVSCEVGQAVLDVIREEGLQSNALEVGSYLFQGLLNLKNNYDIIGDVRGRGLFLGVELIKESNQMIPASEEAKKAINLMRDRNILLSTDGPENNVIKIKPPLVFNRKNADYLLDSFDSVLSEMTIKVKKC